MAGKIAIFFCNENLKMLKKNLSRMMQTVTKVLQTNASLDSIRYLSLRNTAAI